MKINISLIGVIVLLAVAAFFGKGWLDDYYGKKLQIAEQNHLADSTEVSRLTLDSIVMFHRYAQIVEINDDLIGDNAELITDRNDKVLSLTEAEIRIKELESEEVTAEVDTVEQELFFRDIQRGFYSYDLFVSFPRAYHKLKLTIKPFSMSVIVTERISDGIYSGYLEFFDEQVSEYISVTSMEVYIDETLFDKRIKEPVVKLGLAVGVLAGENNALGLGVGALLGNKHYVDAKYGIGNNTVFVNYTWLFW